MRVTTTGCVLLIALCRPAESQGRYSDDAVGTTAKSSKLEKESIPRVGQIIDVGNSHTPMNVILRELAFAGICPGQILTYPDLRIAERNLTRLGIFKKPTVTVVDNPNHPNREFKDVLVTMQEKDWFDVCCDFLDEWGYLLDVRSSVIIPCSVASYVWNAYWR